MYRMLSFFLNVVAPYQYHLKKMLYPCTSIRYIPVSVPMHHSQKPIGVYHHGADTRLNSIVSIKNDHFEVIF